jgi:hypothetical protein
MLTLKDLFQPEDLESIKEIIKAEIPADLPIETRSVYLSKEGRVPYRYKAYWWVATLPQDVLQGLRDKVDKRYLEFHYKVKSYPPYWGIAEKVRLKDKVLIKVDLERGEMEFSFYS